MKAKARRSGRGPAQLRELLNQPYSRVLTPGEGGQFVAQILEFPECSAQGKTPAEAYAELERAALTWLGEWLASGRDAPRPLIAATTSGRFALRLPKGLYVRASRAAALEGVSLNQYICSAVAERIGGSSVRDGAGE